MTKFLKPILDFGQGKNHTHHTIEYDAMPITGQFHQKVHEDFFLGSRQEIHPGRLRVLFILGKVDLGRQESKHAFGIIIPEFSDYRHDAVFFVSLGLAVKIVRQVIKLVYRLRKILVTGQSEEAQPYFLAGLPYLGEGLSLPPKFNRATTFLVLTMAGRLEGSTSGAGPVHGRLGRQRLTL
jgi:hypothetical protein